MPTTTNTPSMPSSLEADMAALLNDLLAGQGELMAVLNRKRNLLGAMDREGLAAIAGEEQRMLGVLQDCLNRRQALLARAAGEGLPPASIQALTNSLPPVSGNRWPAKSPRPGPGQDCCKPKALLIGSSFNGRSSISHNC